MGQANQMGPEMHAKTSESESPQMTTGAMPSNECIEQVEDEGVYLFQERR